MDRGPLIFLGVLMTFVSSWLMLVFAPFLQLNFLGQASDEATGDTYPPPIVGMLATGRDVYQANGCMYCHSQQVRPKGFGADIDRGWGGPLSRRTVARDYLHDNPIMLGTMRTGPDLANIGARQPSALWHHEHLFDPAHITPGSIMPPYQFLYRKQKVVGYPSADALKNLPEGAVEEGYEIVPTPEAKALVLYLQSLDKSFPLEEADQ